MCVGLVAAGALQPSAHPRLELLILPGSVMDVQAFESPKS